MEKIIRPGRVEEGNLYIKIEYEDKKEEGHEGQKCLSLRGVVGPLSNGNCRGSAFQNQEELLCITEYAPLWNEGMAKLLYEYWTGWHLNDMRARCAHQTGQEWDVSKVLQVQTYSHVGALKYGYLKAKAKVTRLGKRQQEDFEGAEAAWSATFCRCTDDSSNIARCEAYVKRDLLRRREVKPAVAGWVYPSQHPEGLLCKSCPVCGYKYGSSWLYEQVPDEVISFLFSLPETDLTPEWV